MQVKPLIAALLIGTAALAGCQQEHTPDAAQQPAVSPLANTPPAAGNDAVRLNLPALPIIRNAVFSLTPTFNGQRDPQIMSQVCGLARGELTQGQVNTFLGQRSIDPAKLPKTGNPLSLLVNGDKTSQTIACAAYLATSVMLAPDANEYMKSVAITEKAPAGKAKPGAKPEAKPSTVQQLDTKALSLVLPVKLAVARANADIFALIASQLQREPGLTLGEYRNQAMQLFTRLAPVYLQRVKAQMPNGVRFDVVRLGGGALVFRGSDGSFFDFDGTNLRLMQSDVLWFGEGRLMGQEYPLSVAYFDASVQPLLVPAKH
ncbi:hypothetical protein FEA48_27695 [Pseudomonas nitroreducens]|uniref:DUF3298 domain-containing protein n=1 Tax=Pseudomonas nitroreducens TaxID=46680 RepID=A0A5R8ZUM3_PSENT|nr:hypothetical protein [Pseudomonas nitroreducens]TLP70089.1 hypothetical protein FEA48_27695 [Pseudomonas nitroreducens]